MKVLHISYVKQIAGAERHLLYLLPGLRKANVDVRMLILNADNNPPSDFMTLLEDAGVPVEVFPVTQASPLSLTSLRNILRLRAYLRAGQYDIVHAHLYNGELYGIPAARLAGISRVVSTRHSVDAFRHRWYWRWLARLNARVISNSKAVDAYSRTVEHVPAERNVLIFYGMPPPDTRAPRMALRQELGLDEDTPLVGTVARLTEAKGYPYALEAFAQLRERIPDAHYVIAGDGELGATLEAQAQQLGLTDVVHFLGWRSDTERVYAALDVFLLASLWEGLPMALLEVMGRGLPIVSTTAGPMPEVVVEGETGYLVHPANANALVEPLAILLTNRSLARQMGEAGRKRLEQVFSVETMIAQTAALYHELM
jgi:glycosyltransferase involved in cell wall biosynthesis